jgi:hypothetical protein
MPRKIKINPLTDPAKLIRDNWIPRVNSGKIARNNKLDFIIAIERSMDVIPSYVKDFYLNLSPNTLKAVERRKIEIEGSIIR